MERVIRQTIALIILFGGIGCLYLWLGVVGTVGAFFGMTILFSVLGVASGYWVGLDSEADMMVTDLMKWLKQKRSS